MEARVLESYRRDGIVPPELVRHIQSSAARRNGSIVTTEEVERYCRDWLNQKLAADAKREAARVVHSDDRIERAIDVLMSFSPKSRPKQWAESLALVQEASRQGRLTRAQVSQLDALDTVYASKAS